MAVPFLYNNGTLVLFLDGDARHVEPDHPSYGQIKKCLRNATVEELKKLLDVNTAVQHFVDNADHDGLAEVHNGIVFYNGKPLHNALATRVLDFMRQDLPFEHLLRFCENVEQNPSYKSRLEGFDFLDRKGLPVTEDGHFLAFKAVKKDYLDKWSGTIDNSPGQVISINRNLVDDDRSHSCSQGLHVGALDYVCGYGCNDDRIVVVKVNPRDVVSVPQDCDAQKLRTCCYEVLHDFGGKLERPLYDAQGDDVVSPVDDEEYDWSWSDEEDGEMENDDCFEEGDVTSEPINKSNGQSQSNGFFRRLGL